MTTKFLNFKFSLSKFYCRDVSHKKQAFLDDFPLCPKDPPPPQKRKIYFYCRLAVSENPTCDKPTQLSFLNSALVQASRWMFAHLDRTNHCVEGFITMQLRRVALSRAPFPLRPCIGLIN